MNRSTVIGLAALAVISAAGGAVLLLQRAAPAPAAPAAAAAPPVRQPLYWYDPMVPDQHFEKPGKSPFMDMQLVPKYADEADGAPDDGGFRIDPRVVQNLGVRRVTVERRALQPQLLAAGVIAVDEHGIAAVQARAAGWVEHLGVKAVGDPVRRGQRLAAIQSPELLAAQGEFLLALRSGDAGLQAAARARLALLGVGEAQLRRIAASGQAERRVELFADRDGYVLELGVREGAQVQPGMNLLVLAGLDSVWLTAELPEAQGAAIVPGAAARVTVAALPGQDFGGRVEYVYPELSGTTRTVKLRIALPNRAAQLRPGMYASVQLEAPARTEALAIPSEAVIRTGSRSLVLVADDDNHFRPVPVRTGLETGDWVEVLDGLEAGQQVVASGQFLIDSEANLRGALERLAPIEIETAPAAADDPHAGHAGHAQAAAPASDDGHAGHEDHSSHPGHTP